MSIKKFALPLLLLLVMLGAPLKAAEPQISALPNPVDRGHPGRVIVTGLSEKDDLSGSFDNRPIMFFAAGGQMIGLFGVDVMTSPGRYPLEVKWKGGSKSLEVSVRDHKYGERSLKVAPNQVDLSPEDLARANREKELTSAALATKSPNRLWNAPFMEPVPGPVNSSFGRQTKINGVVNPNPHGGADFPVAQGTEVKAPADGVVILTGFHFFAGGSVYIDHGQGLVSMFFHLSKIDVKDGDTVKRGQVVGRSGKTGRVTGAHLHYGLYLCGARIDPLVFHKLSAQMPKV